MKLPLKPRTQRAPADDVERQALRVGGIPRSMWVAAITLLFMLVGAGITVANGLAEASHISATLTGHYATITKLDWSADGKYLASASLDNRIRIWDMATGRITHSLKLQGLATGVSWSPDGTQVAAIGRNAQVLSLASGRMAIPLQYAAIPNNDIDWSPDGAKIAGASGETIFIWNGQTLHPLPELFFVGHKGEVNSVAWTADGTRLASASDEGAVRLWNASAVGGDEVLRHPSEAGAVKSVAWSPDSQRVVSGAAGGQVYIWDVESKKIIQTLTGHADQVTSVDWSPDGQRIASGSSDQSLKIWDAADGSLILSLSGNAWDRSPIGAVRWSRNGTQVATASGSRIRIWNVTDK
ncbi:MAG: WD40 repeat domain-containing protein [Chloroflexota bacterium]|nr:WD40 repeat domain-containing protein [Chloroflexota bacterium]